MVIIGFITGVILWTFMEYLMHRFLGHVHKGKNFFKAEHLQHHSKFAYFAPGYKKALSAIVLFIILFFVLGIFVPKMIVFSFLTGFYGMYALYELAHFRFHARGPIALPFLILRKHHFYHHFHNPKTNFGVTSRFWDRVFGTFTSVEKVRVPKKMAMPWLMDGNDIKKAYALSFYLSEY